MLTENVSYFYDFSIDIRKDVRYNTNIHTEYMFGIFVWNICIARIIYNMYFRNLFVLDFVRKTPRVHIINQEVSHHEKNYDSRSRYLSGSFN